MKTKFTLKKGIRISLEGFRSFHPLPLTTRAKLQMEIIIAANNLYVTVD